MGKFKLNDSVWFMENNKPVQKEIKAIVRVQGEVKLDYKTITSEEGKEKVVYLVGFCTYVEETDCFKNFIALKRNVFNLKNNK